MTVFLLAAILGALLLDLAVRFTIFAVRLAAWLAAMMIAGTFAVLAGLYGLIRPRVAG